MILNVHSSTGWRSASTPEEISALITDVMRNLESGHDGENGWVGPEKAWFYLSDRRMSDGDPYPDNFLCVSINRSTGYGGLMWEASPNSQRQGQIYGYFWVTDNPNPPDFDPEVIADTHYPLYFNPRSTIPLPQIQAALEEFCRTGTGARPECVSWVRGSPNGRRDDQPPLAEDGGGDEDDPWADDDPAAPTA